MKITKYGELPEPPKPWWLGIHLTCDHCKAEVELEAGDKVREWSERTPFGHKGVSVPCPTPFCGRTLSKEVRR